MFSRQSRMVIVNIIYSKTQGDPQSCVYEASNWNWKKNQSSLAQDVWCGRFSS